MRWATTFSEMIPSGTAYVDQERELPMKRVGGLIALLILVSCSGDERGARSEVVALSPLLQVVHGQMDAFNRHDVAAMAAGVAPDFVWFSVAGEELTVEVRGRVAFAESMRSYFASLPSVRSELEESLISGSLVTIRERASWTDGSGVERSQTAMGVYEVQDGLIQRVWYYPAER